MAAISPHLDDVVLGCAGFVAAHPGTTVVTVTAGRPGPHTLTDWDAKCGFHEGEDAVGARRLEDEHALRLLRARPVWLEFLDHQYGPQAPAAEVAAAVLQAIGEAAIVASPLGLGHDDHLLIAKACLDVARSDLARQWVLYEDVIYRRTIGGTEQALARLRQMGFELTPVNFPVDALAKRTAIAAYASQVRGLGALLDDAYGPEQYWTMTVRM